jgi:hypothetical protein
MNPDMVNEADLLEQRTGLRPDEEPELGDVETAEADPADVQEQRVEVADEEERRDE